MAIQDTFSLSNALESQSYAYKCWYDYNYGKNTMCISSRDMGKITQTWKSELSNWKATALDDENAYEIPDDDFSMSKLNGRTQAENKTGYDGNNAGSKAHAIGDASVVVGGEIAKLATKKVVQKAGEKVADKAIKKVGEKTASKATQRFVEKSGKQAAKKGVEESAQASKNASSSIGCIVGCTLGAATAASYWAKKPNKDEKEACDALQDEMVNAQGALNMAQEDMSVADEEVIELSDEAQITNEDANATIEDKKSEYDAYKASYDALMEKVKAGEPLTEDEKALLKELIPLMQELGIDIGEIQEDTTDVTGELYDEIGTYQEIYDNAAQTVGEVQGLTDYAASFDSSTQTMCYVEGGAQSLNALTTGKASYEAFALASSGTWAFGATAWAYAFGVLGAVGAASSGLAAKQQFEWAGNVGTEIGMRKDAQELNSLTNDIYDERIADYEGYNAIVEDLEIEVPDDLDDMQKALETPPETPGTNNGGNNPPILGLGSTVGQGTTPSGTGNDKPIKDKDKDVRIL